MVRVSNMKTIRLFSPYTQGTYFWKTAISYVYVALPKYTTQWNSKSDYFFFFHFEPIKY